MKLVKLSYSPVEQQGHWLDEIDSILSRAIETKIHLKDAYSCGRPDQDKTIVIYALLGE